MPELPEVEAVRRSLLPIVGRRFVGVEVTRWDVVEPTSRQRRPRDGPSPARTPEALLVGGAVAELVRHGKHMAIVTTNGRALDVHLGMSGQVLLCPRGIDPPRRDHVHVMWTLDDGSRLLFRDPRRFGGLWPAASLAALRAGRWAALGPDALTLDEHTLLAACKATRRNIKAVLMDQATAAGLGNIYVVEALFDAGIRPTRPARRVTHQEAAALAGAIRDILTRAIDAGGSTLRDFLNGQGQAGGYQSGHRVYGRGGESCVKCGETLRQRVMQQRTTVWCPSCQR